MVIRRARPEEAAELSAVAQAAKAHWPYSDEQLAAWRPELTVSAAQITLRPTFVLQVAGELSGFHQLVPAPGDWVLEHFWLLPRAMGRGLGRRLLENALEVARAGGATGLLLASDPYAEGFYLACGAQRVGSVPAPIPGEPYRALPRLRLPVGNPGGPSAY